MNSSATKLVKEEFVQRLMSLKRPIERAIITVTRINSPDVDKQRRGLMVIILSLGLLCAALLALPTAFLYPNVVRELATIGGGSLMVALAYALARRGYVTTSAVLLITTISLSIFSLMLANGNGLTTPYYLSVSVLVAGLILRPWHIWLVVVGNLIGLGMTFRIGPHLHLYDPATQLALADHTLMMIIVALLGFLGSITIEQALHTAQRSQAYAEEIAAVLEQRVIERTAILQERETRYRDLAELTSDVVYSAVLEPDGTTHLNWVSESIFRITGYRLEEIDVQMLWNLLLSTEDQPVIAAQIECVLKGNEVAHEMRVYTADGQELWMRNYIRPQYDITGAQIIGILGAAQDITERKQAEATRLEMERSLLHTQKLESLGVLAGGVAHDFNNLLTGILGNVELLSFEVSHQHTGHELLAQIQLSARRAAELTQQILAYAGKGRFVVEPLNINNLITEMPQLLDALLPKTVSLQLRLAPSLLAIDADATQIRQVVLNLLLNAAEAMPPSGGAIYCATRTRALDSSTLAGAYSAPELPAGEYIELEVRDNGMGMAHDTLARIFDPFFTTKFAGRGLGLAAVVGIVRGHGGAICVQSAMGAGTTFSILFPPSATQAPMANPTQPKAWPASGQGTVLIVDDEASIRLLLQRIFERQGFDVLTAADGQEGVDMLHAGDHNVICVLLDLTMPRLDGLSAFITMRQRSATVPIVVMSGYSAQSVSEQFPSSEALYWLQKPFTVSDVWECMRHIGVV